MATPLKICFAASEVVPLAKTGGLGDVTAALSKTLHENGHDVRLFLPFYSGIDREVHDVHAVEFLSDLPLRIGWRDLRFSVFTTRLPDSDLWIYLIDCPELFHRPQGLYTSDPDEPVRFAALSQAVLTCCQYMGWSPDVVHSHDWHTALLPLLMRTVFGWDALFQRTRTVLTIHNIGYQGMFPAGILAELALDPWSHLFDQDDLGQGRVSFLRTGVIYSDVVTTVSPTYAREIQSDGYGMGLQDVLRARNNRLLGILNGVDYDEWSPERDRLIPFSYSREDVTGKHQNKRVLQEKLGLAPAGEPPMIGIVSRLVHQKGFDLCYPVLPELLATRDMRMAVLGSGEQQYEDFFQWLQQRFPDRVVFYRGYNNELAHLIEAGSDIFVMPSRYEPCGLNQMFSLKYGTIPVVRNTGGLADSVHDARVGPHRGNGFQFDDFTPDGLHYALGRALDAYRNRPAWRTLMSNAMAEDYSWGPQAQRYEELYHWLAQH